MSLGTRIKILRKANRLTTEQFAQKCDVESSYIQKVEKDQVITSIRFVQLTARLFNVSTDYILGMTDKKERIMEVVNIGKCPGDVVIQMLLEAGMIVVDENREYQVADCGIILTEKQQGIIDLVRRHNYLRKLRYQMDDLDYQMEEYHSMTTQQQIELIDLIKSRLRTFNLSKFTSDK